MAGPAKAGPKGRRGKGSSSQHPTAVLSWGQTVTAAVAAIVVAVLLRWQSSATGPQMCQRLDASTLTVQRFNELVRAGQPAVLVGADSLPELRTAARRWGQRDYLIRAHGDLGLQVSLSASEEFEGVELAAGWPGAQRFWSAWRRSEGGNGVGKTAEALSVAGSRYQACSRPSSHCVRHIWDRVVVRPALANTTLRDVLTRALPSGAAAGYVQYESIPPSMLADLQVPAFAAALKAEFAGMWLGRGRTSAQLHHDANENLLLMVRGRKTWRLFPPTAGDALHEGYMLEVQQQLAGTNETAAQLERAPVGLSNASLSFFTSPVSLARRSTEIARFPELETVDSMGYECDLEKGDMIFVPSWWWHQVETATESEPMSTSEPGPTVEWSAAVNFWFEPYFVKTYGCATCRLQENPQHPPLN
jgi:hypothetical protein